jgi:hypothetical protein
VVFQFPPGKAINNPVVIRARDLCFLEPGELLNDNLVDFCLKHMAAMFREASTGGGGGGGGGGSGGGGSGGGGGGGVGGGSGDEVKNCLILTSLFFQKLMEGANRGKAHKAVARWVKNVDVFSKK